MSKRIGRPRGLTTDGPKIRRLRVGLGLTATQVGARVGCDAQTVRRAERGGPIGDVFVSRLAKALNVEVEDIAGPEPEVLASLDANKARPFARPGQRERKPAPSITTSKGENPE